ncbi:MAG: hypothetical protein P0S95_02795 [Rhabdochlamydiaceae bacterium]|nr:hypothetical protein [Candidatus Amphrikana amoebophyrae]
MQKKELDNIKELLINILKFQKGHEILISEFQNRIWDMDCQSEAYEILSILAYDLDFYEPDESMRKHHSEYVDKEVIKKEIINTLKQL